MKFALKLLGFGLMMALTFSLSAQTPDDIILTESGDPNKNKPLDDIVEKKITFEKRVLPL